MTFMAVPKTTLSQIVRYFSKKNYKNNKQKLRVYCSQKSELQVLQLDKMSIERVTK